MLAAWKRLFGVSPGEQKADKTEDVGPLDAVLLNGKLNLLRHDIRADHYICVGVFLGAFEERAKEVFISHVLNDVDHRKIAARLAIQERMVGGQTPFYYPEQMKDGILPAELCFVPAQSLIDHARKLYDSAGAGKTALVYAAALEDIKKCVCNGKDIANAGLGGPYSLAEGQDARDRFGIRHVVDEEGLARTMLVRRDVYRPQRPFGGLFPI